MINLEFMIYKKKPPEGGCKYEGCGLSTISRQLNLTIEPDLLLQRYNNFLRYETNAKYGKQRSREVAHLVPTIAEEDPQNLDI